MSEKYTRKSFAKKSFGQNFLVDPNYIRKIIEALDPQADETIIEIGAGRGALTEKLLESSANVLAIEFEREMVHVLQKRFGNLNNFQLIPQDALQTDFSDLINPGSEIRDPKSAKLVANLPYNISTAILQRLIEQREVFSEMILMFQREVVERIIAKPGNKERGFLSVLTEAYLQTEKLFDVPPKAFRPSPKVWSAVVRLITSDCDEILSDNKDLFREIVSAGFAQKRKTILNNLKNAPSGLKDKIVDAGKLLIKCQIEPNRRAETLTLPEWKRILVELT